MTAERSPPEPNHWLVSAALWPVAGTMALALMALAHVPLLALESLSAWARRHYRFFPLVPLAALPIAWRASRWLGPLTPGARRPPAWLLGACWALLAGACTIGSPLLGTIAAMLAAMAVAERAQLQAFFRYVRRQLVAQVARHRREVAS
jgi:hypothetical protein